MWGDPSLLYRVSAGGWLWEIRLAGSRLVAVRKCPFTGAGVFMS